MHLRLPAFAAFLAFLALFSTAAHAQSLDARLNAILENAQLKNASVSADIEEIGPRGATPVFSHDATLALGPGSNCKLLTTAAAFEKYGPGASFKTQLYRAGPDLVLLGGGDPGFADAKICAAAHETPTSTFEQWAAQLKQAGITQYRNLVVDDRIFDHQFFNPNWPANQRLDWYCAPIAGLNFNANCLDYTPTLSPGGVGVALMPDTSYVSVTIKATRGSETRVSMIPRPHTTDYEMRGTVAATAASPISVPIDDPGLWTGTILRDILTKAGVQQTGQVRRADDDEAFTGARLLLSHETPLMAVLERANTNSVNMMAECLCKRLGYDATGKPGTWASGTAAVEAYVSSLGVKGDLVSLDDGSGLSNKNRVAARAFTTVLAHVATRPDGKQFIDTLAIPTADGTLLKQKRFKGLKVASHVHAKTGHIDSVSTLSGYVFAGNRTFVFSILMNKYEGNVNPLQDQMCEALYLWATGK